ncbi:MAG TPA: hypothetical protein VMZ50_08820 [Phycisphaerae bacterium]|nr:hypothetical protein [Phycisphaerae bacterium]
MGLKLGHLPPQVASRLRAFYLRTRFYRFLRMVYASAAVYGILALLAAHVDRFFFLDASTRVGMFWAVHVAAAGFALISLLSFLLRRPSVRKVAYELESRVSPNPAERYVTLDNVLLRGGYEQDPVSQDLVQQLELSTIEHSAGVRAGRLARDSRLRVVSVLLILVAATYTLLLVPDSYQFPLMMERFLFPGRNLPKPSFVRIQVHPAHVKVGKGEGVVIEAEISGEIPPLFRWVMKKFGMTTDRCLIAMRDGETGPFPLADAETADMARVQRNLFLFSRGNLQGSFRHRIRCGDAETRIHTVRVIAQPKILGVTLKVTCPEYAKLPPQKITDLDRPLRFLPESRIELSFRTDQPVRERIIQFEKEKQPVQPDWNEQTLTGAHAFVLKKKVTFEIKVVNREGYANVDRTKLTIDILEDRPPTVRLEYPTEDMEKVPSEIFPVRAAIEDDLGIAEVNLVFTLNPDQQEGAVPKDIPVEMEESLPRTQDLNEMFDLDKTRAVPGDVVSVHVRARDSLGNDGRSREIRVRIVPFTRGENERKRLIALEFLTGAMKEVRESPRPPTPPDPATAMDIATDPFDRISTEAARRDVVLGKSPSVATLLDLLEKEQHFTDAARSKEVARKLCGLLRFSAAPFGDDPRVDPYAFRAQALRELSEEILPGLIHYRRLKNITWRLFGMRYEAENIGRKLTELHAMQRPDPGLLKSADKRAELYLKTLQDIGEELIELSRRTAALDADALTRTVGQMNTTGYFLKRPDSPLKKRMTSAEEVAEQITVTIEAIRRALPALFEKEAAARVRLDGRYREILLKIAALRQAPAAPGGASAPDGWYRNAAAWLDDDSRLMKWNPFLPFWPRLVNLALSERLAAARSAAGDAARRQREADLQKTGRQIVAPGGDLAKQIHKAAAVSIALALDWETDTVHSLKDISNTEKTFESMLLAIEEAQLLGEPASQQRPQRFAEVLAIDLRKELPGVPAARGSRDSDAVAKHAANLRVLAAAAELRYGFPSPALLVERLGPVLEQTDAQLAGAEVALRTGLDPTSAEKLLGAVAAARRETEQLRRAIANLSLQIGYLPLGKNVEADELLMLKVRDRFHFYLGRTGKAMNSLQRLRVKSPDPAALTELRADFDTLTNSHRIALRGGIEKALAERKKGDTVSPEDRKKYTILPDFARTRRYLETTEALLKGRDSAAVARAFIEEFKEAGLIYLADRAELIDAARSALVQADAAAAALGKGPTVDPKDLKDFHGRLDEALRRLNEMKAAVEQSGEGELQDSLAGGVAAAITKISRLRLSEGKVTARIVSARRFVLDQIATELESLGREVRGAAQQRGPTESGILRGGPTGILAKELAYQAETTRSRLLGQFRLANRRVTEGVLEALAESPDEAKYHDAAAWAVFLHRLVRSDLYGVGSQRVGAEGPSPSEPLLKWLRSELDKAVLIKTLKNYAKPTAEYLRSARDALRY